MIDEVARDDGIVATIDPHADPQDSCTLAEEQPELLGFPGDVLEHLPRGKVLETPRVDAEFCRSDHDHVVGSRKRPMGPLVCKCLCQLLFLFWRATENLVPAGKHLLDHFGHFVLSHIWRESDRGVPHQLSRTILLQEFLEERQGKKSIIDRCLDEGGEMPLVQPAHRIASDVLRREKPERVGRLVQGGLVVSAHRFLPIKRYSRRVACQRVLRDSVCHGRKKPKISFFLPWQILLRNILLYHLL